MATSSSSSFHISKDGYDDECYPTVLSSTILPVMSTTKHGHAHTQTHPHRTLAYNFVIRSLRRRLWKAFREDDSISVLRVYLATLSDFRLWLEEEEDQRRCHHDCTTINVAVAGKEGVEKEEQEKSTTTTIQTHRRGRSLSSPSSSLSSLFSHHRLSKSENNNNNTVKNKAVRRKSQKFLILDDDDHNESSLQQQEHEEKQMEDNIQTIEMILGGSNIPILQFEMNPSDYFMADDFLSPYDYGTYHRKEQKKIPDSSLLLHTMTAAQRQQHTEEERKRLRRSRRRSRLQQPRIAFRRIFSSGRRTLTAATARHRRNGDDDDDNDDDFGLVNSLVVDSFNEHDNTNNDDGAIAAAATLTASDTLSPSSSSIEFSTNTNNNNTDNDNDNVYMTTPLHEAARLGFGDFVRFLLANGGDANKKNGHNRTAIHMCAGGFTFEEDQLLNNTQQPDDTDNDNDNDDGNHKNKPAGKKSNSSSSTDKNKKRKKKKKKKSSLSSSLSASSSISGVTTAVTKEITEGVTETIPLPAGEEAGAMASSLEGDFHSPTTTPTTTSIAIGIRATVIPKEILELFRQDPATATTTMHFPCENGDRTNNRGGMTKRRFIGRIFHRDGYNNKNGKGIGIRNSNTTEGVEGSNQQHTNSSSNDIPKIKPDPTRLKQIVTGRMDAMMGLLTWIQKDTHQGPSINAVDMDCRTALHYAAEMGRTDICLAILLNSGVILTVVDDTSRTPCEVAALHGHISLATQLEARALLYVDPYGLDDDMYMMDNMMAAESSNYADGYSNNYNHNKEKLVPPFCWFQTKSKEEVVQERSTRLVTARQQFVDIINENNSNSSSSNNDNEEKKPSSVTTKSRILSLITGGIVGNTNTENSDGDSGSDINGNPIVFYQLERFMAHHKWDLSAANDAFRKDPKMALAALGVPPLSCNGVSVKNGNKTDDAEEESRLCTICYDDDVAREDWMQLKGCNHGFCTDCLLDYTKECATNRMPFYSITCPSHNCDAVFPFTDIHSLLIQDHSEIFDRIREASTENFITSSSDHKFCPHPGCTGVVHRLPQPAWTNAGFDASFFDYTGAVCVVIPDRDTIGDDCTLTYEGVEDLDYTNCRSIQHPPKAHRFCYSCLEPTVHWPLTCEHWKEWKDKVTEEIGDIDGDGSGDFNELAQKMWLKANTRPCPSCKAPIEKNDGCNHMLCNVCRHEFCWVCRKDWSKHTIKSTDGYFRCNIWEKDDSELERGENATNTSSNHNLMNSLNDEGYGTSTYSSRNAWRKKLEMKRFLHHYSKYVAHEESFMLEQKMANTVVARLAPVVEAAIDFDGCSSFNFGGHGISFIHNAFFELSECRTVLQQSYAFSYFRYPSSYSTDSGAKSVSSPPLIYHHSKRKEKARFQRMQSELEMLTEQMSDIVARSHLRATQMQIIYLTTGAAEKRVDLTNYILQIYREEKKEIDERKKRQAEKEKKIQEQSSSSTSSSELSTTNRAVGQQQENQADTLVAAMNNVQSLRRRHDTFLNDNVQSLRRRHDTFLNAVSEARRETIRATQDRLRAEEFVLSRLGDGGSDEGEGDGGDYYDEDFPTTNQMWACSRCTFMNTGGTRCYMCASLR